MVFTGKTVAGLAGMVGCFNPKTKGWTNTRSGSGFPAGKAFRFSGWKGVQVFWPERHAVGKSYCVVCHFLDRSWHSVGQGKVEGQRDCCSIWLCRS